MLIYLVVGETGEYEDRQEWTVCACINKNLAEKHANKCNVEAERIWNLSGETNIHSKSSKARIFVEENPPTVDPDMRFDYTGTSYYVVGPIGLMEEEE